MTFYLEPILLFFNSSGQAEKLLISVVITPIIYVFGVISDRMVDSIFDIYTNSKLRNKFFNSEDEYREARSLVYMKSDALTDLFEYGRVRIRICRNWIFNGILILVSALIFINYSDLKIELSYKLSTLVSFFMLLSVFGACIAWRDLNIKEFKFLKIQSKFLLNE